MSVREFTKRAFKQVNINIIWKNKGLNEIGIDAITKKILIQVNKKYFRPTEVFKLQGNSNKAKKILKWQPEFTIDQLNLPACDFIQLDVEGYEINVLHGAAKTIEKYKPGISCENGNGVGIPQFLAQYGYKPITTVGADTIYIVEQNTP